MLHTSPKTKWHAGAWHGGDRQICRYELLIHGPTATFTYDDASQLTSLASILRGMPDMPIESFTYGYDPVGNRTSLADRFGVHTFGYDVLSRLTSATHPVVAPFVAEAFSYDPVGNRTSSHLSPGGYAYETANRLLEDDTFIYTYDGNGNLTTKTDQTTSAVTTYTYDGENQLTRVALPDGRTVAYRYDGLGRRMERAVTAGATERFLYDQEDLVEVYNLAGCWQQTIFHGPGIDQPYAFIRDTDGSCSPSWGIFAEPARYLTTDGLGSITALSAAVGGSSAAINLAERYVYDSFGNLTITDASGNPRATSAYGERYFFTGREYDFETGLYHNRRRDWDPTTGRFVQEDPVLGITRLPLSFNRYLYVGSNPTNKIDPFGDLSLSQVLTIVTIVSTLLLLSSLQRFGCDSVGVARRLEDAALRSISRNPEEAEINAQGLYGKSLDQLTREELINVGRTMMDFKRDVAKEEGKLVIDGFDVVTSSQKRPTR